jgi:hypothetical protein
MARRAICIPCGVSPSSVLGDSLARLLAGRGQLDPWTFGERFGAHRIEHLERRL